VFNGSGCYTTDGILIIKPVTINGGTYNDPVTDKLGRGSVHPLIRIKDTTGVTVENVTLNGLNAEGGFHGELVGEEGVQVLSSANVTLDNVTTNNTYGDGLMLGFQPGRPPTTNLTVNGYTVNHAGRQGVTIAYAINSTLNNVAINSSADSGWDFESDVQRVGSGNVTVNNASGGKGIRIVEALQGPITFNNCQCERHVTLMNDAAASGQPVTFNGGTILLTNIDKGVPPAGVTLKGPGNLTFTGVTLGRLPAMRLPTSPAWFVTKGGHLTLNKSPAAGPQGYRDSSSTVTISS
jgi:hypothetical protein